jgi:hypothetical protein
MANFKSLLEETLLNPRLEIEKNSDAFWPSEGGINLEVDGRTIREGGCSRKTWYRLTGHKKEGRGKTLKALLDQQYGLFAQNLVTETVKVGRAFIGSEVPIQLKKVGSSGKFTISGSIDLIYQDPTTGVPVLVEMKTTGRAFHGEIFPTREGVMAPKPAHAIQCLPYLDWARNNGIVHPELALFYVERAQHASGEHTLRLDDDDSIVISNGVGVTNWPQVSLRALYADFDRINQHVLDNVAPPRPYKMQYDNTDLVWMADTGRLNKTDTAKINKIRDTDPEALSASAPPVLIKGDFLCGVCEYAKICYGPGLMPSSSGEEEGAVEVPV